MVSKDLISEDTNSLPGSSEFVAKFAARLHKEKSVNAQKFVFLHVDLVLKCASSIMASRLSCACDSQRMCVMIHTSACFVCNMHACVHVYMLTFQTHASSTTGLAYALQICMPREWICHIRVHVWLYTKKYGTADMVISIYKRNRERYIYSHKLHLYAA